jgi:lipopolysaccharide/colanic/teichoic acid biosynthesis glycosyltransferase
MVKRLFDLMFAAGALLVSWPLILLGALAVKLTSAGPAFYRAKRAGLGGLPFDMFKLRTMSVGSDAAGRRITEQEDERVTVVGRLLRKLKIDELPQFWNVLRGEMSIVGPRPEDWTIVEKHYGAWERQTLTVRPGITSAAEVRWYPDLTYHAPPPPGVPLQQHYLAQHLPARLAEEFRYVENHNFLVDLKVIARTLACILVHSWLPPERQTLILELPDRGATNHQA